MKQLPLFPAIEYVDDDPTAAFEDDSSEWDGLEEYADDLSGRRLEDDKDLQRYDKLIENFEAAEIQRELHEDFWCDRFEDDEEYDYATASPQPVR